MNLADHLSSYIPPPKFGFITTCARAMTQGAPMAQGSMSIVQLTSAALEIIPRPGDWSSALLPRRQKINVKTNSFSHV